MLLWVWLACSAGADKVGETGGAGDDTAGDTGIDTSTDTSADTSGDTSGDTSTDTSGDTGAPVDVPAFAYLYPSLGESCGGCHTSEYVGAFYVEDDIEATHDRLLNLVPHGDRDARYVVPGDPDASLLLQKLSTTPPFGDPMPPEDSSAPALDPVIADALRAWVAGGAPLP